MAILLEEERKLSRELISGQVINIKETEKQLDIMVYAIELLKGEKPLLETLFKLADALEFREVAGVDVKEFMTSMASCEDLK